MQNSYGTSSPSTPGRIRHRRRLNEIPIDASKTNGSKLLVNDQNKYKSISLWQRSYLLYSKAPEDRQLLGFRLMNWVYVVHSYTKEEDVQVSVWAVCLDTHDSNSSLYLVLNSL
ncbi:hypothetical protein FRX31_014172 [Thalictrum thalictroides]|uniref:Uncharacterized protein n=1 Tax=Thalictrum thalictroides TaxID=46969 RepID=A0A7J6WH54_THATH|nr:hypothetical protein FRX31_014172 [Thalictrum thalictroides]